MLELIIDPLQHDAYSWRLQAQDNAVLPLLEGQFQLSSVELKGKPVDLRKLDHALAHFNKEWGKWLAEFFDENAQLQLGKYLYGLIFSAGGEVLAEDLRGAAEVALRVVSADSFIQRLPWNLLVRDKTFLVLEGWHIAVAATVTASRDVDFPGIPSILLVCPEPASLPTTEGERHANTLMQYLRSWYEQFLDPNRLAVVQHWPDFVRKLTRQHWDVIYFYGHGDGDDYGASLFFTLPDGTAQKFSMPDLAKVLKNRPPHLLYLNACRSGNGQIGSAITHLEGLVPAIVVNRTDAFTAAAREQAQTFLTRLLLDHYPPHQAITSAYSSTGTGMTSVRWMTPILYQHYRQWTFPKREVYRFASRDTHWYLKLDRTSQFNQVNTDLRRAIMRYSPNTVAFFWYGTEKQGVNRFHERLPVQLRELNPDMEMLEFDFRWPAHFHNEDAAYDQMLCEGFHIQHIEQLPGRLDSLSSLGGSVPLVAHCRFATLYLGSSARLPQVAGLLRWWNAHVHPLLQRHGLKALLALAFELPQAEPGFTDAAHLLLGSLEFEAGMELKLLDELGQITAKDVKDFLHNYEVRLPVADAEQRNRLLRETIGNATTNGEVSYEKVLLELQTIVARAHTMANRQPSTANPDIQKWL
ncbi:MAG: CHAT domain-containing protein [Gammaproteobacteria bacterium]|nr:CHAT domain-containing protein [Gammaproteobacteria bacterium]